MSNSDLIFLMKNSSDKKGFKFYLRNESIKKLLHPNYIQDKTYNGYLSSKFYVEKNISYSEYIAEQIDKSISYSEYIYENLDKSVSYYDYISEQIKFIK